MGIRVHKMLGYGLTDVLFDEDKYRIVDPRINVSSRLLDYGADAPTLDEYLAFSRDDSVAQLRLTVGGPNQSEGPLGPFECVVHDGEYGLGNVLCIRPVGTRAWGWYRYDDTMDWMEESTVHDQQNRVQVFDQGIYPFTNFMNAETGEKLGHEALVWVRARNSENADDSEVLDYLAELAGFASHEDAQRLVVPAVPDEVRALAQFGQLFTDDRVWMQLRPMLYVYWG